MTHLAGIDKGPVLDWTDDNGLLECFRKWKKKVEILFWGPLNAVGDGVKCNYVIYWSRETGMELVDKWETEGKITDANRYNINRYFELFEAHILPKSNALIMIVELKRLFMGSISLEDFHTKALRLVKEGEYPKGDTWNRILKDIIISDLASNKIQAKIIKEGKDVTLARVMEIAWSEVSTQRHIDRMQETAKVNYVHYGKGSKKGKSKPRSSGSSSGGSGSRANAGKLENPLERAGKFHYPMTSVGDVEKGGIQKVNPLRQWKQFAGTVEPRDIMRKCVWRSQPT